MALPLERAVARDDDGQWRERMIKIAKRYRVRVVSDRALASNPIPKTFDDKESAGWTPEKFKAEYQTLRAFVIRPTISQRHQFGHGEEFEVAIDLGLDLWTRPWNSDHAWRKEADAYGVMLALVADITNGIAHEITIQTRPGDDLSRWLCSCNASGRTWVEREIAEAEADAHRASYTQA